MTREQIPDFIRDIVEIGCDPIGVAGVGYVIGDADLPPKKRKAVQEPLHRICESYGDRDHLLEEITAYLVSIGRSYPPPERH